MRPQERATKISHTNTAKLANGYGDKALAQLCGVIAADEGRHELAYQAIVQELLHRCVRDDAPSPGQSAHLATSATFGTCTRARASPGTRTARCWRLPT